MYVTHCLSYCFFFYFRSVCIQGENNRETEAWFDALSKAMEVSLFTS